MSDDGTKSSEFARAFTRFIANMNADAAREASTLIPRLREHLGGDPTVMPIVAEEFEAWEHPNVQVALDAVTSARGRRAELIGIGAQNKRWGQITFSDLLSAGGMYARTFSEGPVDFVNFRLEDERVLACVQFGLYLLHAGDTRSIVFVAGPPTPGTGPRVRMSVEVMSARRDDAAALLRELTETMRERNVYRGKVISLAPGQFGVQALVKFHRLPAVARDDIVLPAGALESIERQTIEFSAHAAALLAAGRSLKRGMLLYGPPGTGKTLTVMYLVNRMAGRTVILTSGLGLGLVGNVGQFARTLAPATVIIEDVDLIAQERGFPGMPSHPLLFELLNQLDGLAEDADVLTILTTNRPDILEPALAARPGRVDLVVELPVPDAEGRRQLLRLYSRGMALEGVDLDAYVARTDGASPAYIKELFRKAALVAAIEGSATVRDGHLDRAMQELAAGGELAKRIVGFGTSAYLPPAPSVGPMRPAGFPDVAATSRRIG